MTQDLLKTAQNHHVAGRLAEAQAIYRQLHSQQPNRFEALHMLGVIEFQMGRLQSAMELISRAIQINPNCADCHGNLGLVLSTAGQIDRAIVELKLALQLKPNYAEAHNNLGIAYSNRRQYELAVVEYRAAAALSPNHVGIMNNLGATILELGNYQEAMGIFQKLIQREPNNANAYNNLGNALQHAGRLDESIAALTRCLQLRPRMAEAHNNLGRVYQMRGEFPKAIASYRNALQADGKMVGAWSNLAAVLAEAHQIDEAADAGRKCVEIAPDFANGHNNLASILKDIGELDQALAHWDRARSLDPKMMMAHSNRIFCMHFHPAYDAAAILQESRDWDRRHAQPLRGSWRAHGNTPDPERRLKIGYVSPDFYAQAEAHYVVPLLEGHHRDKFEIHCYSSVGRPDVITGRIRQAVPGWHEVVRLSDEQVAEQIRADKIDILVDLTMHMREARLLIFARKPAPVQVTWLAYPGGTGLEAIDYRFTDPYLDPEPDPERAIYSEKSVRLASYWGCYDPLIEQPDNAVRRDGPVCFGSLNNPLKLNDGTLRRWADVLKAVPESRLLMLVISEPHRRKILRLFADCGIDASRLEFVGRMTRGDYLRTYGRIDVCLDALPYNGSTTACDSLWMGVPMVTLVGHTACGRVGMSTMCNVGLPEVVARTPEEFLKIAIDWAADLDRLAHWRRELRGQMVKRPLMDRQLFVESVEGAYRRMWREWCRTR